MSLYASVLATPAVPWRVRHALEQWVEQRCYARHPALYRFFLGTAQRLHALTPPWQGGWTASRTPMKPAAKGLRARLKEAT